MLAAASAMGLLLGPQALAGDRFSAAVVVPGDERHPRGERAIDALGDRLPAVAQAHGLMPHQLRALFRSDPTLSVSLPTERLAYFDPHWHPADTTSGGGGAGTAGDGPTSGDIPPAEAPPTTDPVFSLESLPGANFTIFLDFDGHTTSGTSWNASYGVDPIVSPPFDTNGNTNTWSASELSIIGESWKGVAEDFRPFGLNVTTKDPGREALRKSGSGDTQWGVRVVVTSDTFANCGCGGHAFVGSFQDSTDEPAFVYTDTLSGVREAASHEVGHTVWLSHDGTTSTAYYAGHGSGAQSWAPLMGVGYNESTTQWSKGEYRNANNAGSSANFSRGPDDLHVIATYNGFGFRVDDHGDTPGSATALDGTFPEVSGVIARSNDVDVFSFTTDGGPVDIAVTPTGVLPNLKVKVELSAAGGSVIAVADDPAGLAAQLTATVEPGTYFVEVDGTGIGNPFAASPTGFTEYGSVGAYALAASLPFPLTGTTTLYLHGQGAGQAAPPGLVKSGYRWNGTGPATGTLDVADPDDAWAGFAGYAHSHAPLLANPARFTTAPLAAPLTLGDALALDVWLQSDGGWPLGGETSYTITDVSPTGQRVVVWSASLAARYAAEPFVPKANSLVFPLESRYTFAAGHRIEATLMFSAVNNSTLRLYYDSPAEPSALHFVSL